AGSYLLEFEVGIVYFDDTKAPQQGIAFPDNVNLIAIGQKRAAQGSVGNCAVSKKFHVTRERWRWRWRQRHWPYRPPRGHFVFLRLFLWGRDFAEGIATEAVIFGFLGFFHLVAMQLRVLDRE